MTDIVRLTGQGGDTLRPEPGTYALVLRSTARATAEVGRWGSLQIRPGYYVYVGSAFGAGGVRARLSRHFRAAKQAHWHIDYLTPYAVPTGAWYSHHKQRLEHRWARTIGAMDGMSEIPRFGCSDCACFSHLFQSDTMPDFDRFCDLAGGEQ